PRRNRSCAARPMAIDPCANFRFSRRAASARIPGCVNSIDGEGSPKLIWGGDVEIGSIEGADFIRRWPFVVEVRPRRESHDDGFVRHWLVVIQRRSRISPRGELTCRVMNGLDEHSSSFVLHHSLSLAPSLPPPPRAAASPSCVHQGSRPWRPGAKVISLASLYPPPA